MISFATESETEALRQRSNKMCMKFPANLNIVKEPHIGIEAHCFTWVSFFGFTPVMCMSRTCTFNVPSLTLQGNLWNLLVNYTSSN